MKIDKSLLIIALILFFIGITMIYFISDKAHFIKQLLWGLIGLGFFYLAWRISSKVLFALSLHLYLFIALLLILVLIIGTSQSKRWFNFGLFSFQPSEFAKIAVVLSLAKVLGEKKKLMFNFRSLFLPVLLSTIPTGLTLIAPDLGTSFSFLFALAIILYFAEIRPYEIFLLFSPLFAFLFGFSIYTWLLYFFFLLILLFKQSTIFQGFTALAINSFFGLLNPLIWQSLREYQRARIISFFAPWFDPKGVGWSAIQSQIAIGSGRIFGRWFLFPPKNNLDFVPNIHTDFIFAAFAERFGFLGFIFLLGLFLFFLYRIFSLVKKPTDLKKRLAIAGFGAIFLYHIFINLGMVCGVLPVTGLTLSFVSYGGSSLVANFIMLGLILNFAYKD